MIGILRYGWYCLRGRGCCYEFISGGWETGAEPAAVIKDSQPPEQIMLLLTPPCTYIEPSLGFFLSSGCRKDWVMSPSSPTQQTAQHQWGKCKAAQGSGIIVYKVRNCTYTLGGGLC